MSLLLAIAVLVVTGAAQDAGPDVVDVHQAVIVEQLVDGGPGERAVVVGGCWLSTEYCEGYAGELASKRARVTYLEAHSGDAPFRWILGAALIGVALGAASVASLECGFGDCFGIRR